MSFTCIFFAFYFAENQIQAMLFKHRIFNSVWLIDHDYAMNYLPLISAYIKGEVSTTHLGIKQTTNDKIMLYSTHWNEETDASDYHAGLSDKDIPKDTIAVINITGAITKYDQFCGPEGMITKAKQLHECYANPNIKGIVIKQDTGGGEARAMHLFNEAVKQRNKPVIGFIDDYSCSAGMGNLAACDLIIANSPMAQVGSIGTYVTIVDYSEKFKNEGINLIDVYATASSDKNREYKEALQGNTTLLQASVDKFNNSFIEMIEEQRGDALKADRSVWGTGKVFFAEEALAIGLIDKIDSFDNILNYF